MGSYHLSPEAETQIIELVLYGAEQFGIEQASKYHEKLEKHFEVLADNPMLYPSVD